MNTLQIDKILQQCSITRKYYLGCFPSDAISNCTVFPCTFILNFDPSVLGGSHWISVFVKSPQVMYYFDPLAIPSPPLNIATFLSKFKYVYRNKFRYQSLTSNICGKYAIVFIYYMSKHLDFNDFIKFLDSVKNCDQLINKICSKIYTNCIL